MSKQIVSGAAQDLRPYMVIEAGDGRVFRWHGGEYIDIGWYGEVGAPGIDGDDFHAFDLINVWDYEAGAPRIARSLGCFEVVVREFLAREGEES